MKTPKTPDIKIQLKNIFFPMVQNREILKSFRKIPEMNEVFKKMPLLNFFWINTVNMYVINIVDMMESGTAHSQSLYSLLKYLRKNYPIVTWGKDYKGDTLQISKQRLEDLNKIIKDLKNTPEYHEICLYRHNISAHVNDISCIKGFKFDDADKLSDELEKIFGELYLGLEGKGLLNSGYYKEFKQYMEGLQKQINLFHELYIFNFSLYADNLEKASIKFYDKYLEIMNHPSPIDNFRRKELKEKIANF